MQKKRLNDGVNLKDIILGGQDGLVNVLGVILGVAAATSDSRIVIIAGLSATFAESISMAAVAYTSSKAARDYYKSLKKYSEEYKNPLKDAFIVGFAAIIGSIIPLLPFFFLTINQGIITSFILSIIALFFVGAYQGKITNKSWKKSGLELALIGILAAVVSYFIGDLLGRLIM